MRILELFAGIGGCAAALPPDDEILAVEQSPVAQAVYRTRHRHQVAPWNITFTPAERWAAWGADLWWMSPPCQPYTARGAGADLDDPRAQSLRRVLEALATLRPSYVAVENVPGFVGSRAHQALQAALTGYQLEEQLLCPTDLGVPMRRLRYYLVASRAGDLGPGSEATRAALARGQAQLRGEAAPARGPRSALANYLDPSADEDAELRVPEAVRAAYPGALNELERDDPDAVATCFTAAYGRSFVRSGAYLRVQDGLRFFAPEEIAALMGFGRGPLFPPEVPRSKRWALIGNSLSVDAVRAVLSRIPAYSCGGPSIVSLSSESPGST
ncbi:MAG: DNA cytosine methyltransferase [Myxococcales bacterium]|nr:DNA cytosine methyltransferase [Myxococcales bacterium]